MINQYNPKVQQETTQMNDDDDKEDIHEEDKIKTIG